MPGQEVDPSGIELLIPSWYDALWTAVVIGVVLAVVLLYRWARRRDGARTAPTAPTVADRLVALDRLHTAGTITDTEYEAGRARILGDL
ncbi:SHOCT domain-containing protein [Antribacter gilvus]|uniref:SHOCT domain-containing protein n=1 Tax=Antribacter gilvus TaxID=2304675 RepID=UPI000F79670B|nr:SHOCT domain-containing protein [Antribacter gilvus]